jgi:transposase
MARAYSLDLRERVVGAIEEGLSTHQAAARFSIGVFDGRGLGTTETLAGRRSTRPAGQAERLGARCAWRLHPRCARGQA